MAKQFGSKYQKLIDRNPNQKSEFNNNPGIEQGLLRTKNPYVELINKWGFIPTFTTGSAVTGRSSTADFNYIYYVDNGYVNDDYVEVQFSI